MQTDNTKDKLFNDVVSYIDKKRIEILSDAPLFSTLKNHSLSKRERLLFMPYMLFYTIGSPDIKTLMMYVDKPDEELTVVEKKINSFIREDNFHYNYYINDLERLGYEVSRFGSTSAIIRHVFAEEGIPARRLVYAIGSYLKHDTDPLIGLAITEIIEAALFGLFTTVYQHITKYEDGEDLNWLQYFGDTHVELEQHHTVTNWFKPGHPADPHLKDVVVPEKTFADIASMVDDLMQRYADMYTSFDEVIKRGIDIEPSKFQIKGAPHVDQITSSRSHR